LQTEAISRANDRSTRWQAFADPWRKPGTEETGRSRAPTGEGDEATAQQPLSIGAAARSRPIAEVASSPKLLMAQALASDLPYGQC